MRAKRAKKSLSKKTKKKKTKKKSWICCAWVKECHAGPGEALCQCVLMKTFNVHKSEYHVQLLICQKVWTTREMVVVFFSVFHSRAQCTKCFMENRLVNELVATGQLA